MRVIDVRLHQKLNSLQARPSKCVYGWYNCSKQSDFNFVHTPLYLYTKF